MRNFPGVKTETGFALLENQSGNRCAPRSSFGKGCRFTASVENRGESVVCSLEYPLLDGLVRLAEDGSDSLAHSYATGILCHDPFQCFFQNREADSGICRILKGFPGRRCSFFCYYAPGAGGLHFAAYDSKYHQKWLNFYRAETECG